MARGWRPHGGGAWTPTAWPTRTWRARTIAAVGPLTATGGLVWAIVQPYRITLLHPHGQGFWWLVAEPPLYVVLVGIAFRLLIAPGIVKDLEQ